MRITKTFELAQALQTGKMYLIKGYYGDTDINEQALENALDRVIPNFHNLTSVDSVSDESITVTYNVRDIKRL